jgi:hypothetical protein
MRGTAIELYDLRDRLLGMGFRDVQFPMIFSLRTGELHSFVLARCSKTLEPHS